MAAGGAPHRCAARSRKAGGKRDPGCPKGTYSHLTGDQSAHISSHERCDRPEVRERIVNAKVARRSARAPGRWPPPTSPFSKAATMNDKPTTTVQERTARRRRAPDRPLPEGVRRPGRRAQAPASCTAGRRGRRDRTPAPGSRQPAQDLRGDARAARPLLRPVRHRLTHRRPPGRRRRHRRPPAPAGRAPARPGQRAS